MPLPKLKAAENTVKVRFTYDVNGLLQVEATVASNKKRYELVIQQNPGLLSEAEIRTRLAQLSALKVHPREDQANVALIARAERLYGEFLQQRELIKTNLTRFMSVLEAQDLAQIARFRQEFQAFLDEIEQALG